MKERIARLEALLNAKAAAPESPKPAAPNPIAEELAAMEQRVAQIEASLGEDQPGPADSAAVPSPSLRRINASRLWRNSGA